MLCLALYFQGIEGSTAIGVTQVVTTSVGMTDIDIRAVSGSISDQYYYKLIKVSIKRRPIGRLEVENWKMKVGSCNEYVMKVRHTCTQWHRMKVLPNSFHSTGHSDTLGFH